MNTDIRISTSFLNHRKRKKLESILGEKATSYILDLWLSTAINNPNGVFEGMDVDDIALDANWTGSPNIFIDAMVKVRFLDPPSDSIEWYSLHDWAVHQPWACNADDRSSKAAKNQAFRWCVAEIKNKQDKEKFKDWYYGEFNFVKGKNREAILAEYDSYTNGNTPIPSSPILPYLNKDEPFRAIDFLIDLGVKKQIASDFLKVREKKKQANTITAFNTIKSQILKSNQPPNDIIKICVEKGWAGFRVSWLKDEDGVNGQNKAGGVCDSSCFNFKTCKSLNKTKLGEICGGFSNHDTAK